MPSLTIENYLKAIYQLCQAQEGAPTDRLAGTTKVAATGKVAAALGVSPGTVTSMLRTLSSSGLAEYTPYEGVRLTEAGRSLAVRVVRRHRLIELFLVRTLQLSWDAVHAEAENMEHAVSDFLVDRIDAYLGFPTVDPHGDPIPRSDGTIPPQSDRPLAACPVGSQFRLVRVLDQSPEFLRYLTHSGLPLGAEGRLAALRTEADLLTVHVPAGELALARSAAEKLLVVELG